MTANTGINITTFELHKKNCTYNSYAIYDVKEKKSKNNYTAFISSYEIDEKMPKKSFSVLREANFLCKMIHPSIAKFIGYCPIDFVGKHKPVLIIEFCQNQTLEQLFNYQKLNPNFKLTDNQKLNIIYGIASGMHYLHSNKIIHRNLNPKNILLNSDFHPKIFGFDHAVIKDDLQISYGLEGFPAYTSPEIWKNGEYSESSDVYAFSIIVFQIMTGQSPFENLKAYEIFDIILEKNKQNFEFFKIPEIYKNLIESCMSKDPKKRPSFEQIIQKMKNDKGFITPSVNEEEYHKFIDFISKSDIQFFPDKQIHEIPKNDNLIISPELQKIFKDDPTKIKYFVLQNVKNEINTILFHDIYYNNYNINFDVNKLKESMHKQYMQISNSDIKDPQSKKIIEEIDKSIDDDYFDLYNNLKSKIKRKISSEVLNQILEVIRNELQLKKKKPKEYDMKKNIQSQINLILDNYQEDLLFNAEKLRQISLSKAELPEILENLESINRIFKDEERYKNFEMKQRQPDFSVLCSNNKSSYLQSLPNILSGDCIFVTLFGESSCTRNILSYLINNRLEKYKENDLITLYGPVDLISLGRTAIDPVDKLKFVNYEQTKIYFFEISNEIQSDSNWYEFISYISHILVFCSEKLPDQKQINDFQKVLLTQYSRSTLINCSPNSIIPINFGKKQFINIDIAKINDNSLHNLVFDLLCDKSHQFIPSQTVSSYFYDLIKYKKDILKGNDVSLVLRDRIINDYVYNMHCKTMEYLRKQIRKMIDKISDDINTTKYINNLHFDYHKQNIISKTIDYFYTNMYPEFWDRMEVKQISVVIENEIKDNYESQIKELKPIELYGQLILLLKSGNLKSSLPQAQSLLSEIKKLNYKLKECTIPKDLNPKQIKSLKSILKKEYKQKKQYIFYKENFEQMMNSITNDLKTFIKENPITSDQEYGLFLSKFIENRSLENDEFLGKIVPFALQIRNVPEQYRPNNFYIRIDTESFNDVGISLPQKNLTIMISNSSTCKELYKHVQKVLKLKEIPFYISRLKQNSMKQTFQVQVFDDEISVSELNSYEFSIHYGLIIHSTKTYIESLIVAQTFKIDDDFIIKTNSRNAKYKVKLPKNRHGVVDVVFDITNDSPTKETDECLILMKLTAEDISNVQEGNAIIHQYRVGDKWITDPQPVFVSYPKCDVIAVYLNHCSDNKVTIESCKLEDFIPENKRNDTYSRNWEGMNPDTRYYRGRRPYYLPVGYQSFGIKVSNFIENTCVGFHGTSLRAAKSIIETGFLLPSQLNGVRKGHIPLNECCFGINNFPDAIFVSPSIKYSSFAYSIGIIAQNDDTTFIKTSNFKLNQILLIILQVRVKPNSFTVNKNTTIMDVNDQHYSNDELEWRIPNPNDLFPYRLLYIGYEPEEYKRITNQMIRH